MSVVYIPNLSGSGGNIVYIPNVSGNSSSSSSTSTDHHSGWYNIASGETVSAAENKQMTLWGSMILEGSLQVEGQFIVEV